LTVVHQVLLFLFRTVDGTACLEVPDYVLPVMFSLLVCLVINTTPYTLPLTFSSFDLRPSRVPFPFLHRPLLLVHLGGFKPHQAFPANHTIPRSQKAFFFSRPLKTRSHQCFREMGIVSSPTCPLGEAFMSCRREDFTFFWGAAPPFGFVAASPELRRFVRVLSTFLGCVICNPSAQAGRWPGRWRGILSFHLHQVCAIYGVKFSFSPSARPSDILLSRFFLRA